MDRYPMTPEGHQALTAELKHLQTVERPKISKEIGIAREHGDLRENAEYHAAKEKQGHIEARIAHLEGMLSRAEVVEHSQMTGSRVKFGATVSLEDLDSGEEKTFRIVGPEEADIKQGTISVTSPMARACINHEVGDDVRVNAPGGVRKYPITDLKWK
jgi:transcription elongation factor GreA